MIERDPVSRFERASAGCGPRRPLRSSGVALCLMAVGGFRAGRPLLFPAPPSNDHPGTEGHGRSLRRGGLGQLGDALPIEHCGC